MSFIYPRVISITRPQVDSAVGKIEYGGQLPIREVPIRSSVTAAIQAKSQSSKPNASLPGDASKRTLWNILIPPNALPLGTIRTRDVIADEIGTRYQIISPAWTSLGYNLICEKLET